MDPVLSADLDRLPELLQAARDFAVQEVSGLDNRPVARLGKTPAPDPLPDGGAGAFQPGSVRARRRTAINRKDATWQSSP